MADAGQGTAQAFFMFNDHEYFKALFFSNLMPPLSNLLKIPLGHGALGNELTQQFDPQEALEE